MADRHYFLSLVSYIRQPTRPLQLLHRPLRGLLRSHAPGSGDARTKRESILLPKPIRTFRISDEFRLQDIRDDHPGVHALHPGNVTLHGWSPF